MFNVSKKRIGDCWEDWCYNRATFVLVGSTSIRVGPPSKLAFMFRIRLGSLRFVLSQSYLHMCVCNAVTKFA